MFGTEPRAPAAASERGLIELVGELAGAGLELAQNTAQMAACESRVVARRVALRMGLFFAFLIVAATGLLLVLGGVALLLEQAGLAPWAAFGLIGLVTLAAGAFFAYRSIVKLGDGDIAFPLTLAELERDVDTLAHRRGAQES